MNKGCPFGHPLFSLSKYQTILLPQFVQIPALPITTVA